MPKMIFLNMPVADVARSTAFYEAVGAVKNPQFSDETASCMVFSETIHVMVMTHDKFRMFTSKAIANSESSSEVLICMSAGSRAEVDHVLGKVAAAGGKADHAPVQDHGFMYGRSFEDPDGHVFELMWMDVEAMHSAMAAAKEPA